MPGGVLIGTGGGARVASSGGVKATNASGACPDCACGGTTPCCVNQGHCRWDNTTSSLRVRGWYSVNYSMTLLGSLESDKFPVSGLCEGFFEGTTTSPYTDTPGVFFPCSLTLGTFASLGTRSCAVPSGTTGDQFLSMNASSAGTLGGGAGGVQTATAAISFQWTASLQRAGNPSVTNSIVLFGTFGFQSGVPRYRINDNTANQIPLGMTGTVTVTPIMDNLCIVGARMDFNLQEPSGQGTTRNSSGYFAFAICTKFLGCNSSGIACGATPPGAPSLLGSLDDALFS